MDISHSEVEVKIRIRLLLKLYWIDRNNAKMENVLIMIL